MNTDVLKQKLINEIETKINTRALTCEELKDLCTAFKELRANEYLEKLSNKYDDLCTGFATDTSDIKMCQLETKTENKE